MSKKYSIRVEDDEVSSVEVDGIAYDSPDQIPDAKDREKIQELILKSNNEGFDEGFDDEFEAEFRELERQSARFPKVIPLIFMIVAAIMLVIAAISTIGTVQKLSREERTIGQVVDMTVRQSRNSESQVITDYYYPVVEFNLSDGTRKQVQLSEGSWPPAYEIGEPVTILYDREHPLDARIQSASSTILNWILPGITGTVGIIFLGVTILVSRFFKTETVK